MRLSKYPTPWGGSEHPGAISKKVDPHVEFIHSSQLGCVPDEAYRRITHCQDLIQVTFSKICSPENGRVRIATLLNGVRRGFFFFFFLSYFAAGGAAVTVRGLAVNKIG